MISFRNGVCSSPCEGHPTFPACNDKLDPANGVYGTQDLGGIQRSPMQTSPCKGADYVLRRRDYSCRCNVDRLMCNEENTFCTVRQRQCADVEGAPCSGDPAADAASNVCGEPALGGICAFGTWTRIGKCVDHLTPTWPDANYQADPALQLPGPACRSSVCSDHTQCVHVYYTLDGSPPTRSSRLYHGPFLLDTVLQVTPDVVQRQPLATITVRAVAVQEGNLDSPAVASAPFHIRSFVADTGAGRAWAWGHNVRGQLGLGDGLYGGDPRFPNEVPGAPALVSPEFCFDPVTLAVVPARGCDPARWVLALPQALLFNSRLDGPPDPALAAVRAGAYHTLAITTDGRLVSWGWNGYGQARRTPHAARRARSRARVRAAARR